MTYRFEILFLGTEDERNQIMGFDFLDINTSPEITCSLHEELVEMSEEEEFLEFWSDVESLGFSENGSALDFSSPHQEVLIGFSIAEVKPENRKKLVEIWREYFVNKRNIRVGEIFTREYQEYN